MIDKPSDNIGWDVASVVNATTNRTLVRKSTITQGNPDWNAARGTNVENSEWIVKDADDFTHLGSHTIETETEPEPEPEPEPELFSALNKTISFEDYSHNMIAIRWSNYLPEIASYLGIEENSKTKIEWNLYISNNFILEIEEVEYTLSSLSPDSWFSYYETTPDFTPGKYDGGDYII